jgi:YhgE/Pip-like protein
MSTSPPPSEPAPAEPPAEMHVRASAILRVRGIWLIPVLVAAVFVALMSAIYMGGVVNPTGHLHDLPVMVVNQDTGATANGKRIDSGAELVGALEGSPAVVDKLKLRNVTLGQAKAKMNRAGAYATLVIPATLSRSALVATGVSDQGANVPATGSVELLENTRMGSVGVNLAAGVLTPAIQEISPQIGAKLEPLATSSAASNPVMAAQLADPITLTPSTYRPLPGHTALGLSAFYTALLAIMAGFLSATLINTSIDAALGYGATEVGPYWRQRRPVAINRRQTLLVKWAAATITAPVVTGVLVLITVVALHMQAPHVMLLWGLTALASLMVAFGTLTLVAALGSIGQLLALILLVYLSLASSGGTVPIEALPGFFAVAAHVEPLRQVLLGTRAILYFDARGDAGLTQSLIVIACELSFWALVGFAIASWYDRRRLYRIAPDLFAYVSRVIERAVQERAAGAPAVATGPRAGGSPKPERPGDVE